MSIWSIAVFLFWVMALESECFFVVLGESGHQVPIMSAVTFIKMLFHYKQPDAFAELARAMLEVLSVSNY